MYFPKVYFLKVCTPKVYFCKMYPSKLCEFISLNYSKISSLVDQLFWSRPECLSGSKQTFLERLKSGKFERRENGVTTAAGVWAWLKRRFEAGRALRRRPGWVQPVGVLQPQHHPTIQPTWLQPTPNLGPAIHPSWEASSHGTTNLPKIFQTQGVWLN